MGRSSSWEMAMHDELVLDHGCIKKLRNRPMRKLSPAEANHLIMDSDKITVHVVSSRKHAGGRPREDKTALAARVAELRAQRKTFREIKNQLYKETGVSRSEDVY